VPSGSRRVTTSDHPSREVAVPCRVFSLEMLAPPLLRRSPHALYPRGLGYRVFTLRAPEKPVKDPRVPLMGFGSSSEEAQAPSRCLEPLVSQKPGADPMTGRQLAAPPLRFRPLQRLPSSEQRPELVGPASPDRLRLQVLTTSWRLHPPRACRPCFMPDPLLGSPSRAFLLSRSRALFPAPFPSWRSLRLQGLAPRESPPLGPAV